MPRPNYQREKRLKDLARQQKQEEKRNRRFQKEEPEVQEPLQTTGEEADPNPTPSTEPGGDGR